MDHSANLAQTRQPLTMYLLVTCLALEGLSALIGGIGLILDPTGSNVGLPGSLLTGTPFNSFFVPGLLLATILGVWPCVVVYCLLRKQAWAWYGSLSVGVALIIWIAAQIGIFGYIASPPLQLMYGILGIVLCVLSVLPSVRSSLLQRNLPLSESR